MNQASKGAFKESRLQVFPMFGSGYEVEVSTGAGGHRGAATVMLEQIFAPIPPPDPYHRAASHLDGTASILVGISANESMRTGQLVHIDDLFTLPERDTQSASVEK